MDIFRKCGVIFWWKKCFLHYVLLTLMICLFAVSGTGCESAGPDHGLVSALFSPDDIEYATIGFDTREVVPLRAVSRWLVLQGGTSLLFSIGVTTESSDRSPGSALNVPPWARENVALPFDRYPVHIEIDIENQQDGIISQLYRRTIDPVRESRISAWRDVTVALPTQIRGRTRFHIRTLNVPASVNRGVITNPLLMSDARPRTDEMVLMISLDTLRADHLGCYGYPRSISPWIDRLSRESLMYTRTIAPSPWTLPTHYSLFTGRSPLYHGVDRKTDRPLSRDVPLLTERFRRAGFVTTGYCEGGYMSPGWGIYRGFQRYHYHGAIEDQTERLLADFQRFGQRFPLFSFLHTFEIHQPFNTRNRAIFAEGSVSPLRSVHSWSKVSVPRQEVDLAKRQIAAVFAADRMTADDPRIKLIVDDYDEGVRFTDERIGALIAALKKDGHYRMLSLILFSDHGEEFLEHGQLTHGPSVYPETVHVPLIWKRPGEAITGLIDTPVPLLSVTTRLLRDHRLPSLSDEPWPELPLSPSEPDKAADLLSETRLEGNKIRLSDGSTSIHAKVPHEGNQLWISQFSLDSDAGEMDPHVPTPAELQKMLPFWAKMWGGVQIWGHCERAVDLRGTIRFPNGNKPRLIYSTPSRTVTISDRLATFSWTGYRGYFALQFDDVPGDISFEFSIEGRAVIPEFVWSVDGTEHRSRRSSLGLPCDTVTSFDALPAFSPPFPRNDIRVMAFPAHPDDSRSEALPLDVHLQERLELLGYIE